MTALVAFEALDGVRRLPRVVAAALVALPYLAAAYLAQEAFKEPIEALFVLAFALLLPTATTARRAIPLGVIAAGSVYAYSFPGLFWLAGTAAIYIGIRAPKAFCQGANRRRSPALGAALVVLLVLTAPDLGRIVDFTGFRAFKSATISGGLGNLRHQVSPLEALGIWPASDFRLSASDASGPTAAFYLGALVAAAALAFGLPRWIRRHGPAVPAALATAIVVYVGARLFGTVYTSAKALVIAAPLVTLISFGGLLLRDAGLARRLLAAALAAGIALSSFLVLRQAPVGPPNHADQLAELRPLVQGHDVLFLGRDNFVAYELRGAQAFTAVRNYYDPNYVKPDLRLKDVFAQVRLRLGHAASAGTLRVRDHHPGRVRERPAAGIPAGSTDPRLRALEANRPGRAPSHAGRGRRPRRDPRLLEPGRPRGGRTAAGRQRCSRRRPSSAGDGRPVPPWRTAPPCRRRSPCRPGIGRSPFSTTPRGRSG